MDRGDSQGSALAAISGLALILIMFLFAWYSADTPGIELNGFDAFDALDDWVNLILVFAAFSGMALGLVRTTRVNLPAPLSTITAFLGGVAAIVTLIYLISPPGFPTFGGTGANVDLNREAGVWLGLLAAIGVAAGGYMAMQEEGTSFGDAADRVSSGGRAGPGSGPPSGGPPQSPPPPPPPPSPGA